MNQENDNVPVSRFGILAWILHITTQDGPESLWYQMASFEKYTLYLLICQFVFHLSMTIPVGKRDHGKKSWNLTDLECTEKESKVVGQSKLGKL